jgi:hypothetical protein
MDKKAAHLRVLRALRGHRPVSFTYWSVAHRIARWLRATEDPLFEEPAPILGRALSHPTLRELLEHDQLGAWSLDPRTIDLVWAHLHRHRPRTIIECGAGVSTLVIGKYFEACGGDRSSLSLEQDAPYKEQIEARLLTHGMQRWCRVIHAPLSADDFYQIDHAAVAAELGARKADLLLLDGPSGRPGCRVWTLPVLAPFCRPGTRWFLDDAFRDGEMSVLRAWSRLRGVSVDGIYPVVKGFATGVISDPAGITFDAVSRAIGLSRGASDAHTELRRSA